jgi:RNA polymerase sigma factor (sigma-70 family)
MLNSSNPIPENPDPGTHSGAILEDGRRRSAMVTARLGAVRRVIQQVRTRVAPDHGDAELLRRWNRDRDESAFAGLVKRHGGLVLGVCRRVLRDSHAAEDAFQATFLVLAKKADSVRPPGVLGPWLHGVAYRTALKARGRAFRRLQVERDYALQLPSNHAAGPSDTADLAPLIDEQLNALPEKYRRPLVLCGIQGLGKAEAAERLGLPEGTISSRLARAREMLRDRLARRGVVVPAAAVAALLVPASLKAAVQPSVCVAAVEAAAGLAPISPAVLTLSHEVLRAMTLAKFKMLSAIAIAFSLSGGGFGLFSLTADDKKPQPAQDSVKKPQPAPDGVKKPQPAPDGIKKPDPTPDGVKKPEGTKPDKPKPDPTKPEGAKLLKNSGKITNVIPADRAIAVLRKKDNGTFEEYVRLTPDAKIIVDGKPADLKDVPKESIGSYLLKPGAKDGEQPQIAELHVTGATLTGAVVKVEGDMLTIDPASKEGKLPPQAVQVPTGAKVFTGKDPTTKDGSGKLTDLKPGDKVSVILTADGKGALQVNTSVVKPEGDKPGVKPEKPGVKPEKPGDKKSEGDTKPSEKKPVKPDGDD